MTTSTRKCRGCSKKRRLDVDNLRCAQCNGRGRLDDHDEWPEALTGRWVPNGRGTLVYVEQVAS